MHLYWYNFEMMEDVFHIWDSCIPSPQIFAELHLAFCQLLKQIDLFCGFDTREKFVLGFFFVDIFT